MTSKFKVDDKVRVTDGSWLAQIVDGELKRSGNYQVHGRTFTVLVSNENFRLPMFDSSHPIFEVDNCGLMEHNDTIVVDEEGLISFVRSRRLEHIVDKMYLAGFEVEFAANSVKVGCQTLSRQDVEKIVERLGIVEEITPPSFYCDFKREEMWEPIKKTAEKNRYSVSLGGHYYEHFCIVFPDNKSILCTQESTAKGNPKKEAKSIEDTLAFLTTGKNKQEDIVIDCTPIRFDKDSINIWVDGCNYTVKNEEIRNIAKKMGV